MNTVKKSKVNYGEQCRAFANDSVERCSMCQNHPGDHKFPVTAERNKAMHLLREVPAWFSEWNVERGPAEDSLLEPIENFIR